MTKILHIVTDTNIAGVAHWILYFLDASDKSRFTMEVIVPQGAALTPLLAERGVTYHEAAEIADKSFSLKGTRVLRQLVREIKPDIVHTHGSLSGRLASLFRAKVIHTRHSAFPVPWWKRIFPVKQALGLFNGMLSNLIISISPATTENLVDMGTSKKKIRELFNGVPPAKSFTHEEIEELKQKYVIPPDKFILVILARLAEVKGHDDILDVARAIPDALFLVAGDGERLEHITARISQEEITNVRMLGFITEVDEIIAVTDAQLNASFGTEATSLSLLRGMSAGKPAIVSDYGGNPYVIQGGVNGIVYPTRDVRALGAAIKRLMGSPELYKQLAGGALRVYEKRFTDKKMASDTEAVYEEIMTR